TRLEAGRVLVGQVRGKNFAALHAQYQGAFVNTQRLINPYTHFRYPVQRGQAEQPAVSCLPSRKRADTFYIGKHLIYLNKIIESRGRGRTGLPPAAGASGRCGKRASAWLWAALLVPLLSTQAKADATDQIQKAAEQHLRAMLDQQARRQGWQ